MDEWIKSGGVAVSASSLSSGLRGVSSTTEVDIRRSSQMLPPTTSLSIGGGCDQGCRQTITTRFIDEY